MKQPPLPFQCLRAMMLQQMKVITHAVCFEPFQGDDEVEDWVQCACNRWLHEVCMNDILYDKYGRELFCPHCSL